MSGGGRVLGTGTRTAVLLAILIAAPGQAQESRTGGSPGAQAAFSLGPAFPNPFEDETRIPFVLGEDLFREDDLPVVSLRVYNLLHQPVGFASLETEGEERLLLRDRALARPGRYEAVWDGRDERGERVMEGPYFLQLSVDGRTQVRKVLFVR